MSYQKHEGRVEQIIKPCQSENFNLQRNIDMFLNEGYTVVVINTNYDKTLKQKVYNYFSNNFKPVSRIFILKNPSMNEGEKVELQSKFNYKNLYFEENPIK